jgi:hypothetical protein
MAKQYTQSDIHYLLENYSKIPAADIALHLGRSTASIRMIAFKWKLSKPNKNTKHEKINPRAKLIYPYKKVTQCTVPDQTTMSI